MKNTTNVLIFCGTMNASDHIAELYAAIAKLTVTADNLCIYIQQRGMNAAEVNNTTHITPPRMIYKYLQSDRGCKCGIGSHTRKVQGDNPHYVCDQCDRRDK